MHVIPERLITLSQTCLTASQDVGDAQTAAAGPTRVDDHGFARGVHFEDDVEAPVRRRVSGGHVP